LTHNNNEPQRRTRVESFLLEYPELAPHVVGHGPSGWDEVIADCLFQIAAVAKATGVKIKTAQAKEKFGKLRIYTEVDESPSTGFKVVEATPARVHLRTGAAPGSARERFRQFVHAAAARAAQVRVQCGQPATRTMGFYQFCSEHSSAYW